MSTERRVWLPQATTAYALKKVWPEITLHIVPDAGHSSREPGTAKLLVKVRDSPPLLSRAATSRSMIVLTVSSQATDEFAHI